MSESGLEAFLLAGIAAIAEDQLPTGEVGCYSPDAAGRLAHRRSLWAAVMVHEALAGFDPSSAWEETPAVRALLAPPALSRLCRGAARIRQRIRELLAWQELAGHLWRDGGKHSAMPADPALSAAAALALLDDPARAPGRWSLYTRALDRFRGADGLIRTAAGVTEPGVNARVAEFLAVAGEDVETLTAYLRRETGGERIPLDLACSLARCWARAYLPGREQLAAALTPGLLEPLRGAEAVEIADTARLLLALLDLRATSPEIALAAHRLLAGPPPAAGADRCPSLTWALAMAAVARSQTLAEEVLPCPLAS